MSKKRRVGITMVVVFMVVLFIPFLTRQGARKAAAGTRTRLAIAIAAAGDFPEVTLTVEPDATITIAGVVGDTDEVSRDFILVDRLKQLVAKTAPDAAVEYHLTLRNDPDPDPDGDYGVPKTEDEIEDLIKAPIPPDHDDGG